MIVGLFVYKLGGANRWKLPPFYVHIMGNIYNLLINRSKMRAIFGANYRIILIIRRITRSVFYVYQWTKATTLHHSKSVT